MSQYQSFPDAAGGSRTLDKLKALQLPDLAGRAFLDVGCNEGFFCGFARFNGASRAVGVDQSGHFIERARRRFPDCEFHQQGWDSLPEGKFDVILLASALHYAEDQPALIAALVDRLTANGTLVLELGVASSRKAQWVEVKRDIDVRMFPSMPMLKKVLAGYAWKWMGPSIAQDGDPVARHVIHVSHRLPVAYLLMQPPGYGKSSLASSLFPVAGVQVVSGDQKIGEVASGKRVATEALRDAIRDDYSPFRIDQTIRRVFDDGLGSDLVALWLDGAASGDVALDVYVPPLFHAEVEQLLKSRGYFPVRMSWERAGLAPLPEAETARRGEAFYLSLLGEGGAGAAGMSPTRREPLGFVDEILIGDGLLQIRGWAIDVQGQLPAQISVKLGRRTIVADRVDRQLRPDVQRHLDLPHGLVGYRATIAAPEIRCAADLGTGFKVFARGGALFQLAGPIETLVREGGREG